MSILKPGALCVIIAGCPENIGLIVEVIEHLGPCEEREDAYLIRTTSGRPFNQLKYGDEILEHFFEEAITDRYKLRPLVDPKDETENVISLGLIETGVTP